MTTGDDILDAVDEGLARKPSPLPVFTGQPLTGDQLIAALELLPPALRAQPLIVGVGADVRVLTGLVDLGARAVLQTEVLPF